MSSDPTFYPELPCHLAPLREKRAPLVGCACKVCKWLRGEPDDSSEVEDRARLQNG